MKRKIIAWMLLMMSMISLLGCNKNEADNGIDLCDPVVREYLDAKKETEQAEILNRSSGINLAHQSVSFSWGGELCKRYRVSFADNPEYEGAQVYETYVAAVTPDGIFVPGKTYYWKVENAETGSLIYEDSFTAKDAPVRFITTSQVPNVRDLGGWTTEDGRRVKYALIYRGGMTNPASGDNFPEKDVVLFRDILGIRSEIDLRTPQQDDRNQTVSILGEAAPYYKTPMHGYCAILPGFRQSEPVSRQYSYQTTESIREIFHILADRENYPVYFHCNAGADRTGTIAYLINGVLGVSYKDLTRDFELTSFSQGGRRWRSDISGENGFTETGVMQDDQENYVAWGKMHELMLEQYGAGTLQQTIENYLINACGVPQEDIDSLRSIMLA